MAKKNTIRLTESDLKKIISESIRDILKEESYRKSAKKGDKTSTGTKRELNYKKKNGEKDAPRKFHQYAKHNNLDKTAPYGEALCRWEDARNAMHESNEMFNEKEIDDYINMRALSNKKMQDIRIKYKRLYGSIIFDYPDLSSFFDAMMAQGEEIPVKDIESYESAKMMNQKANSVLSQYKEMLKSQRPSPKEELLSGEEWRYHDLYNRI